MGDGFSDAYKDQREERRNCQQNFEYVQNMHAQEVAELKAIIQQQKEELAELRADREAEQREERLRMLREDFRDSGPEKLAVQIKGLRGVDNIEPTVAILQVLADKLPAEFNLVFFEALDLFEHVARREEKAKWE